MNVTTKDVLSSLRQFEEMLGRDAFRASSHIDLNEFLQYLAQQYRQPSAQAMGVAIDPAGFGVYVGMLRRVANNEIKEMKMLEQQFQREVAEKMFRLTKEKFSDDNRKQALEELLEQTNARSKQQESDESSQKRRGGKNNSMQSLSLDMLKRVTDVDVYLDNVLRRKAAADAKSQQKFRKPISSQEIAETDSKLRNQMTRFLMSSQKSKHHSRLKVVTWVVCSIMAKTYALLLSDDKIPDEVADEDGTEGSKKVSESDKEECDCCCVGKDTCICSCTCKCHVESSDEEEEEHNDQHEAAKATKPDEDVKASSIYDGFPVMPTDPFAKRLAKAAREVKITLEEVKQEVGEFLESQLLNDNEPQSAKEILAALSSLETHLASKFSVKPNNASWAGRCSVLELLPDLLDDAEDNESNAGKCLLNLLRSSSDRSIALSSLSAKNEKRLHDEVVPFVRECSDVISSSSSLSNLSSEKQQQWIARRVFVELGCSNVDDFGLSSVEEMIKLADEEPTVKDVSVITFAGSLDLTQGDDNLDDTVLSAETTGESTQQKLLTEQALEKLRKCPYLVDVSLYMDWQERYAPFCGPLLSFIRVHEMILLDHAPSSNDFMFVSCLNGMILRVNEKSTPSDLELLFAQAQQAETRVAASQVAIHLVSMVVTCKGQANFPKQLVQAHLRAYLSSFTKDKAVDKYPERFILEILLETPVQFGDFIVSLLLDVLGQTTGSGTSSERSTADRVWKTCKNDAERKTLLFISSRSLSGLWVGETENWCRLRDNLSASYAEDVGTNVMDAVGEDASAIVTVRRGKDESKYTNLFDASNTVPTSTHFSTAQESMDTAQTDRSSSSDSCRSFIEDLRRNQFGVGLQIQDEATTSVLRIQQQRLERALKRLSDELYSESTHFVLELLQNADDNSYDDSVVPLGDFTLTADTEIVFYNNEQGFSPDNIQAICDVGASTKEAVDSEASIGKKGIGFKSVFKVSDNPQVHSNGFHICFHAKNSEHGTGMGYILPYWIDDDSKWKQRRGTTFVLPLNSASAQRVGDISQSLMAFEPSVLLFLRRIRELRLRDSARQYTLHFVKKEKQLQSSAQIVQLFSQIKKNESSIEVVQQNWLVVKEKLDPPQLFSRTHPTEIALAFPLVFQEAECRPPLQEVFAYLPLRSYGFRFILHGDFEIPSSREAITNGSEWNEWLVSKFPKLVCTAVRTYISSLEIGDSEAKTAKAIASITHLLSLLPLENEVQAPFKTIIPEVMRELRQVKWLTCATPATSLSVKDLLMPSELIDCFELTGGEASENTAALLEALSEDVLTTTFNKRFLHHALSRAMTALMKSQLRIEQLHSSHLMRVLSLSAGKSSIDWTVKVLALLAKIWRKDRHSKLLRQELRLIKCFPLQRKGKESKMKWVSLAEAHDSLFVSDAQVGDSSRTREKSYEFYGDLRILDDNFTKAINKISKLREFLMNDVGIHVMEDHDLIRHHILPKMAELRSSTEDMKDGTEADTDVSAVIEYGRFLSSHFMSCSHCPMQADVNTNMMVATTCLRVVSADDPNLLAFLPSTLKEMPQLASWVGAQLSSNKGQNGFDIVSSEYFSDSGSGSSTDLMDKQWRQVLVDVCGVPLLCDARSIASNARSLSGMEQLLKWIEAEDDTAMKRSISTSFAQHLDKYWSNDEDDSNTGGDDVQCVNDKDNVINMWRKYCWLEGSDGQFHRSTDLWLSVDSVTRLFSSAMVTFSAMTWKNDDFAKRILGMRAAPTANDVLPVISSLSVDSTLVSSLHIDQMICMYVFLWEECQRSHAVRDEITKAFGRKLMLFAPAEADIPHRFIGVKSAVWSSTANSGDLVALETLYPKRLCEFFTGVCGVQRKPSVTFLCDMLSRQQNCLVTKLDDSDKMKVWKKKMLPVLSALSKKARKTSLSKAEIKEIKKLLKTTMWLPVQRLGGSNNGLLFCSSKDSPVRVATEKEQKLQKLLMSIAKEASNESSKERKKRKSEYGINIIQLEGFADDEDLDALLGIARISTLSAHLEVETSIWCKVFRRLITSPQLDNKKSRKKLLKLLQIMIKAWSSGLPASASSENAQLQRSAIFPTIDDNHQWVSAAHMYINDQTDLSKTDLLEAGHSEQVQVLGLFPWNYFVDNSASEEDSSQATRVQKFLVEICGMKSLKAHLQYEVSVLSSQRPTSQAFHEKILSAFALAQRFLIHNHRSLYDHLPHDAIAKLASGLQCMLVDGHDGFQVVYRIGTSVSLRRGFDASSECFLDISNTTLYMKYVTGDEEATALSSVLMEISRKLFGAQVATSVANLQYLSLLQPSPLLREQWLIETQLLPPLSIGGTDKLWVEQVEDTLPTSGHDNAGAKRDSEDMEDGEIATEGVPMKKPYPPAQHNYQKEQGPSFAPLPTSAIFNTPGYGANFGMPIHRPLYPPQPVDGAPFHPPLPHPSSGAGMQSLSLPNTMTKEERAAIGRWGEEYVFNQLKQQHAESESSLTVEWVNEKEESGLPYDLTVSSAGKVVEYIEVKSTRTMEKGVFEISMNELDQAAIHGSTYSIYRVFNAGNPALCRVIRMKNPVSLVRQRKIQLALVMQ
ncbi:unnamed protein product [Phytophthora fragariaefolia]|uniref:Unnamed protein product n=1 Tax=Phytophthora fragariaefolia TaxID=1490495 RepID=A0A9W6U3K7_9STRA|nr:unnamed protein product [Phytophthora fragariaefolia]